MNRGVERSSKAKRPPKKKKREALVFASVKECDDEIETTGDLISSGYRYLETLLEKEVQSTQGGNSQEVLRLLKVFEGRQDRALRIKAELESRSGLVARENSRRLDLSGFVATKPEAAESEG